MRARVVRVLVEVPLEDAVVAAARHPALPTQLAIRATFDDLLAAWRRHRPPSGGVDAVRDEVEALSIEIDT